MESKQKIALIVTFQIVLIMASFLVLVYIGSEWQQLGYTVDFAGLNRFLTLGTILEVNYDEDYLRKDNKKTIERLEENIILIKNGGETDGPKLKPLPAELEEEWNKVYEKFLVFKDSITRLENADSEDIKDIHEEIEKRGIELVDSSDELVEEIASFLDNVSLLLVKLEVGLLITNIVVHVLLIVLVFKILNKEALEILRMERFATIGRIGASIAHDLRNPLTVIKGSIDIMKMRNKEQGEFEEKQYEKINNSIDKIEYLTKDILDFSRVKAIQKEETEFSKILEETLKEIDIPEKIKIKLPKNNYKINIDKIRIQTVLTNLLKNAIDAIGDEGVIEIGLQKKYDHYSITITDSGKGIKASEISKIFDPLFTTKQTGTGLGLASCKRIIEEHGGRISVKTNPTMFIILLPKD